MTSFLSLLEPLIEIRPLPDPASGGDEGDTLSNPSTGDDTLAEREQEAREEAQRVLAQARAEAQEMREDARLQAEAFREAAWQEGFHEGKKTAHAQVEAGLRAQWDAECADFQAQAQTLIDGIVQTRQTLWATQESEMVAFVLDIARQVIKTEVTQNKEVVTNVLHNALRRVVDKEHVRIRVSLDDAPRIREMREDLLTLIDGIKNLEILDDRRVGDGGCVIETGAGTIDAKIETQLAEVERTLIHAAAG